MHKMGSHYRSDQLDHPGPLNYPIQPDQARLKGVNTTSSRHLVDYKRLIIPTYTRALHDLNSATWTFPANMPTSGRYRLEGGISAGVCRHRADVGPTYVLCINVFFPLKGTYL